MRDWLSGGCIDDLQELKDDLTGPEYEFQGISDKLILEPKEKMKKRGHASPDHGDALACTFAVRVPRRDLRASRQNSARVRVAKNTDYLVLG
jgi:hypothetical protein